MKYQNIIWQIIIGLNVLTNVLLGQFGSVSGFVFDADTKQPLIGANVILIESPSYGSAANEKGKFSINAPVGSYSLKSSLIGYLSNIKTDVIVKTNGSYFVKIYLSKTDLELDEVTVNADYFDKSTLENNLSTISLVAEEVRRSPGAMGDFQRILQTFPGVAFSNDQNNELLVRGGSPSENLTILDNMELHSTNHYPNEFNSGGPINMINTDLIQSIQFSTGGFISKYGDKLSSAMIVETREGTRLSNFTGEINLGMAGAGGILEGGIDNGNGSWLISYRKSYIDLIADGFGLTALPHYYDTQFKISYDLNENHKISWSGIYGNDKIKFDGVSDNSYPELKNNIDTVDTENINVKQQQWASGISVKSFWSKKLFSTFTIYGNNYISDILVKNDYTERKFNNKGNIIADEIKSTRKVYDNLTNNYELAFKSSFNYYLSKAAQIEIGGALKFDGYDQDIFIDADTIRFDINGDNNFDNTIIRPESAYDYRLKLFDNSKSYLFANTKLKILNERLEINAGLRYDYFSFSKQGNISPRISATYYLIPAIMNINAAYGEYYQTLAYPNYLDRFNSGINNNLENSHARHYVLGFEHILDEGLKLSIEGYYKQYNNLPVREDFINYQDRTFRSEKVFGIGKQKSYGIDFLLQQKLVKDFYGILGFSRVWSEMEDPRIGFENNSYSSDYEFPYIFNVVLGKRFTNLRNILKDTPFYIKYPTAILPFSNDMEISLKWRYASGKPYTHRLYSPNEQYRVGGVNWSEGSWISSNNINGDRFKDYHRLDLAINSRFNFESVNLVVTLSIQNLYNRKNVTSFQYNSDGTIDNIYQFSILPVGRIELEF